MSAIREGACQLTSAKPDDGLSTPRWVVVGRSSDVGLAHSSGDDPHYPVPGHRPCLHATLTSGVVAIATQHTQPRDNPLPPLGSVFHRRRVHATYIDS